MVAVGNDAFEYSGGETRFIDNQRIGGTIPEMLDLALAFVRRNMRVSTVVDSKTAKRKDKEEYPLVAVMEIVLNSLDHRDYSVHTTASPIRLLMYRDRLDLENLGGLYGRLTIDELGKAVADTRNEFIASILEILIGSENRFTSIPTVCGGMKESGLPDPEFSNRRGQFKVVLRNATAVVASEQESGLIAYCKMPRTREQIAEYLKVSTLAYATAKIRPLIEAGLLKMTIPGTPKSPKQLYYSE
jgi:ATP-dependent DNA helicase RecG